MSIETNKISFTAPALVAKPELSGFAAREKQQVETYPQDAMKPKNFAANDEDRIKALESKLIGSNSALVIEKNPNGTGFIYKSIDKNTGEVIRLWPREEIATALQSMQDIDARGLMLDESA